MGSSTSRTPGFDDRIAIALGQGGMAASMAAMSLPIIISQRISGLGALVILLHFAWWAPLVVIAALIVIQYWLTAEIDLIYQGVVQSAPGLRRAEYHHRLALGTDAAKEIRLFGLAGWVLAEHASSWLSSMRTVWRSRRDLRGEALIALLAGSVAMSLVFGALVVAFEHGSITLAAFTIYGQAALGMVAIASLGDSSVHWRMGARSLVTALDLRPSLAEEDNAERRTTAVPAGSLSFEKVSFSYPGSERKVFDEFDLRIERGKTVAIVGENGSGKTTLIKLLARLYEPGSGRITCGEVDLREMDASAWRRQLAVIFQDFTRYPLSLRENIALGALDLADGASVADAAARAGIGALADELPSGWDTVLSRSYTDGVDLSGGQWQRVALARALMAAARNGILVLDEPTASLDVRQEAAIFDRSIELTRGLTTILISHRFSTVRHADRIVVLADGHVVEDGSHEDLLRAGGRYARLFTLQASRFQGGSDA
ncbi:MAG TPA: ABC transporter ATP-binding protein [Candidatus Dormibacteraeota bacterium]|nr:ABC transporter ATP-binding protein [Candidatus Dormibacteraeota bacterium]